MAKPLIKISVTGIKKTQQKLQQAGRSARRGLGIALYQEGEQIMGASKLLVPVVTGH